jgi:hypothetical protein
MILHRYPPATFEAYRRGSDRHANKEVPDARPRKLSKML